MLVLGPEDSYGYLTRGKWDLAQLKRNPDFRLVTVTDLDHVPMPYRQRVALTAIMTSYLQTRVGKS
jgi:hypothetical protein